MAEYKLPSQIADEYRKLKEKVEIEKDGIQRMTAAGLDTVELSLEVKNLSDKIDQIIKAFKII